MSIEEVLDTPEGQHVLGAVAIDLAFILGETLGPKHHAAALRIVTQLLTLRSSSRCPTCGGTGLEPDMAVRAERQGYVCLQCGGNGQVLGGPLVVLASELVPLKVGFGANADIQPFYLLPRFETP